MNYLTNMRNITKLSQKELELGVAGTNRSWHKDYKDSAWIFVGNLDFGLTEGDVITVFSQYGEIVNINLVRHKDTGKSKGFAFVCYEDQRSTVLAVDNLNGIKLCNRLIRVDHVANYRPPKDHEDLDEITKRLHMEGCAPHTPPSQSSEDEPDAMEQKPNIHKDKKKKKSKKKKRKKHDSDDVKSSSKSHQKKKKKRKHSQEHSTDEEDSDLPSHKEPKKSSFKESASNKKDKIPEDDKTGSKKLKRNQSFSDSSSSESPTNKQLKRRSNSIDPESPDSKKAKSESSSKTMMKYKNRNYRTRISSEEEVMPSKKVKSSKKKHHRIDGAKHSSHLQDESNKPFPDKNYHPHHRGERDRERSPRPRYRRSRSPTFRNGRPTRGRYSPDPYWRKDNRERHRYSPENSSWRWQRETLSHRRFKSPDDFHSRNSKRSLGDKPFKRRMDRDRSPFEQVRYRSTPSDTEKIAAKSHQKEHSNSS